MSYNREMGWDGSAAMKSLPVAWLARALVWALFAAVAVAVAAFCFQCLYWLRFGSWFDWTDPNGPTFPGPSWSGGAWKGANAIFDYFLSAPIQLSASIAGVILVAIYVFVRAATR
jgi:hypothetical protein